MAIFFGDFSSYQKLTDTLGVVCHENDLIMAGTAITCDDYIQVIVAYKSGYNIAVIKDRFCPCCVGLCEIDTDVEIMSVKDFCDHLGDDYLLQPYLEDASEIIKGLMV